MVIRNQLARRLSAEERRYLIGSLVIQTTHVGVKPLIQQADRATVYGVSPQARQWAWDVLGG